MKKIEDTIGVDIFGNTKESNSIRRSWNLNNIWDKNIGNRLIND